MEIRSIDGAGGFPLRISADQVERIVARVYGPDARVAACHELGGGMYNKTYRLDLVGQPRPVVLRIAPPAERQFRSEWQLMRNEYATVPWLAVLAPMMPRVIAADWSHELIDHDYLVQTFLDGVPGPEGLGRYPEGTRVPYFRRLGEITATVHAVRGPGFGPVAGPVHRTWSDAVLASLDDLAADVERLGLDAGDVREAAAIAGKRRELLDEITEPRLLAGDLWTPNVMLADGAPEPVVTGVYDLDRTSWGDPAADWTIRMVLAGPGTDRDVFWETYGPLDRSDAAMWRDRLYEARHLAAIRLERHRLGNPDGVRDSYAAVAAVLGELT